MGGKMNGYAALATGLLATPRPTAGVGPWARNNGTGRTRAEFFNLCGL